ncbi:acyl-CoA thioesterase [Planctomycetales bacterium ZRK34]|nr:acyl-CoA thioesterase [Planctomycetales bacterium ZRK34]
MQHFRLVMPEHMNHFGDLYGGNMLKWVDEIAWIAATRDYPGCRFVTIAMDRVEFHNPVALGAILRFEVAPARAGKTSVRYHVDVFAEHADADPNDPVFTTTMTFVHIDDAGHKQALPQ